MSQLVQMEEHTVQKLKILFSFPRSCLYIFSLFDISFSLPRSSTHKYIELILLTSSLSLPRNCLLTIYATSRVNTSAFSEAVVI